MLTCAFCSCSMAWRPRSSSATAPTSFCNGCVVCPSFRLQVTVAIRTPPLPTVAARERTILHARVCFPPLLCGYSVALHNALLSAIPSIFWVRSHILLSMCCCTHGEPLLHVAKGSFSVPDAPHLRVEAYSSVTASEVPMTSSSSFPCCAVSFIMMAVTQYGERTGRDLQRDWCFEGASFHAFNVIHAEKGTQPAQSFLQFPLSLSLAHRLSYNTLDALSHSQSQLALSP